MKPDRLPRFQVIPPVVVTTANRHTSLNSCSLFHSSETGFPSGDTETDDMTLLTLCIANCRHPKETVTVSSSTASFFVHTCGHVCEISVHIYTILSNLTYT